MEAKQPDLTDDFLDTLLLHPGERPSRPISTPSMTFEYERELTEADLALVSTGARPAMQSMAQRLETITHRHHLAARLVADGEKSAAVAYASGYSVSYIIHLGSDPAFQELVAYYHSQKQQAYLNVHERIGSLAMSVVEELQRRVDGLETLGLDEGADALELRKRQVMPNKELREIAQLALDRSLAPAKMLKGAGAGDGNAALGSAGLVVQLNFGEAPKGSGAVIDAQVINQDQQG